MKTIISPSMLSANAGAWASELELVERAGLKHIHLDIMDGHFVPNISFGPGPIAMLRPLSSLHFDAHLMIDNPDKYIPEFIKAGCDSITVHQEAVIHLNRTLQLIKDGGVLAGVAINPSTPWQLLEPVLEYCDRVLVMTVNPGFGGQKAILSCLRKVTDLAKYRKDNGLKFEIQTDGGTNKENVLEFVKAGSDNVVIGSACFSPGKTKENIEYFIRTISDYELS